MRPFKEASILLTAFNVMSLTRFMSAYRLYCRLFDYQHHEGRINLQAIEDFLILASLRTGPPRNWRERCQAARAKIGDHSIMSDLDTTLWGIDDWRRGIRFAEQLYLQVFHLRHGAFEMTPTTLTLAGVYFTDRSSELLHGLVPDRTLAASH